MAQKPKMNRELVSALLEHEHPIPWNVEFDLDCGWSVSDAEGDRVGTFLTQAHAYAVCEMALEI